MRTAKSLIALVIASLMMTACNTVEGAGKDIKSAGDAIEKTAKDVAD